MTLVVTTLICLTLSLLSAAPPEPSPPRDVFAPVEIPAPPERSRGAESPEQPEAEQPEQPEAEQPEQPEAEQPEPEPPEAEQPADDETPIADEIPDDEIPIDEDLEETPPDTGVRSIVVDASALGRASALDVFTHSGGRTVVDKKEMLQRGATNVGDALVGKPGVRTTEGGSALGTAGLQVGVRGVSPRLSARATVLLDEIPIAPAPYGQPQLSLFPLSLFSIADIDVVRGGVAARYGPQTSGGVFNLLSNPIPKYPRISLFTQGDSNHELSLGGAYGATHGPFGMYLEYAPRFGSSWREHSHKTVHGGLAKFAWQFRRGVQLESLSHGYFEDSELPGGLTRAQYEEDPFQSTRPFDWFRGTRLGTALKLDVRIDPDQNLKIATWYNHSYRNSKIASNAADDPALVEYFLTTPRIYDVIGLEPRWAMRFDVEKHDFSHQLSLGARLAWEFADLATFTDEFGQNTQTLDIDALTEAYAGYFSEKLIMLGGHLTLDVGLRLEYLEIDTLSKLGDEELISRAYWAPLPAASLWYSPIDEFSLFVAYGRSFGPPQYVQVAVALDEVHLDPETSNSIEIGLKALELGGVYGESTVWYKEFTNFIDVGLESFDSIPKIHLWGVESEIYWYPGEVWDPVGDLELYAGYGWTGSYMIGSAIVGNEMPWYPEHEAWAGASYEFDFGVTFGADYVYTGRQYTDYQNRETEDLDAAYGPIPAYSTLNLWARVIAPLATGWHLEFTSGVKNITDTRYFTRNDERNAGILVGRPRTFYINVGFAHDFLPKHLRKRHKSRRASAQMDAYNPLGA